MALDPVNPVLVIAAFSKAVQVILKTKRRWYPGETIWVLNTYINGKVCGYFLSNDTDFISLNATLRGKTNTVKVEILDPMLGWKELRPDGQDIIEAIFRFIEDNIEVFDTINLI